MILKTLKENKVVELFEYKNVPNNWKAVRIKDLIKKIGSGVTPKGGSEIYVSKGIPFLRSQNVYDEGLRIDDVSFITPEINDGMKNSQVRPKDIVINITGASIGRCCLIPDTLKIANINQHILFLRFKHDKVNYIANYLKSSYIKENIMAVQAGTSKEALTMRQALNLPLLVPPNVEQNRITYFLNQKTTAIDKKISLLKAKINYYKELSKSIINEAVCRGLNKNVPLKDSGIEWIGQIPEHWKVKRAKEIFKEVKAKSKTGNEDLLSVSEYYGVAKKVDVVDNDVSYLSRAESLEEYKLCRKGDLVINIMLAWKMGLGISDYDGLVSPSYAVYRSDKKTHSKYYHYLLRTELYTAEFKRNSTGIIESRLRLYSNSFYNVPLLIPPFEEQAEIADYLDHQTKAIEDIVANIIKQIEKLKELRKTLINDVVTGKLKVVND